MNQKTTSEEWIDNFKKFRFFKKTPVYLNGNNEYTLDIDIFNEMLNFISTLIAKKQKEVIEAVLPKDGENIHSVYTICWDCLTWGVNVPNNKTCGNCGSKNTSEYFPDCRQQIITNAKEKLNIDL